VQLPVPGQVIDRYQLVDCIGKGGMAMVFHARMQGIGGFERDVALKVLLPEYASESDFVGMLLDEARIASAILHPCVVGVLDVGRTGELFYLVMEYVDGFDLRSLLRRMPGGRVKLQTSLYLVSEVLRGLHAVHTAVDRQGTPRKIIHRDVSPANVLVDRSGVVKLGDFGIAHASSRITRTRPGALKGKLRYMAPEQLVGQPVDHRADLYAIAIVLVEMLLGADACEPKRMTAFGPVFSWTRARGQGLPADVLDILDKALADRPNDRYRDAAAFRRDLAGALHRRAPGYGAEDLARDLDLVTVERPPVSPASEEMTDPSPARGLHDQLDVSDSEPLQLEKPLERPPMDATVRARKVAREAPPPPSVEILAEPSLAVFSSAEPPSSGSFLDDQKPTMPFHSPLEGATAPTPLPKTQPMPWVQSPESFGTGSIRVDSKLTRLAKTLPWKKIALVAGGTSAAVVAITVAVTLAMSNSSAAAPVVMAAPMAAPPPVVTRPTPTAKPLLTGKLQVAGPAGTVVIGTTNYAAPTELELPAGQYEVKLVRHGRRGRTVVRQIVIEPGREVALRL
jgi:serine/threonine-protein kinase